MVELAGVDAVCIIFLQGITAVALSAVVVQSLCKGQLPNMVVQMQYGFCSLRDHWTQVAKPKPRNACVQAKFVVTLCSLLTNIARISAGALFLRLLAIQGPLMRNQPHQLQPSLDISNLISYPIMFFLAVFHDKVISGRTLDVWYALLQALCVIPLLSTAPQDVTSVSLITLLPRVTLGLCPKRGWLPFVGNVVHWILAVKQVEFRLQSDVFLAQSAELVLLFSGVFPLRHALYENVRMSFELNTRTIDLSAVSGLLLGYCDAVVEVDSSLKLTDASRQLSTLLLHGHGISAGSLAGYDFLSFFHVDDREHIGASLGAKHESTQALALNARMQDSLGNFVKIEILFTSFQNADGEECRLVGMREFQDFSSVAVPLPAGPALSPAEASPSQDLCSVAFDATSFDILSVSAAFKKLCFENGFEDIADGMSIFDLSPGKHPNSLAGYIQTAVNALEPEKLEGDLLMIRDLELFGNTKVEAALEFQTDKMLDAILGTLHINPAPPTLMLTANNLAKFSGNGLVRSSKGSGCPKSSRSSRRQRGGGSGKHVRQGSILDLRKQVMAL
ncbi:hypothetical protein AK812_SmicGene7660 [Symbiodinium microadriaticum]|uniref:PAS domain-containing protein n=1 Tax=Symbiodinium microadriaticum TaxID=2951 RepID=A0A1Q9EN08_SYMMI|nr:hypothetical protein AK812_SmicGene7660 [Symbiodinium microadriaticum]